ILPPSGPILNALARIDPLPSVHGPAPDVPAPTRRILATTGVRAARGSVVRVFGTACGLGVEGSGWVAAPGLVITNAHVVAGESGGPMVDGRGQVTATVFAALTGTPRQGGFAVPNSIVRSELKRAAAATAPAATGRCAN